MRNPSILAQVSRLFFATVSLLCAYEAGKFSYFAHIRVASPTAALAWRPNDGPTLVRIVDSDIEAEPNRAFRPSEAAALTASLVDHPLNSGALRLLASHLESEGNAVESEAIMLLSDRASRRDMLTQLWLIERSVAKNDVNDAIRHYHAALSVHPELGTLLYPVLSSALAFPDVQNALRQYVSSEAPWMPGFINFASTSAQTGDLYALTVPVAPKLVGDSYQTSIATIIHRLAVAGKTDSSLKLVRQIAPNSLNDLTNLSLRASAQETRLGKFIWTFSQSDGVQTSFDEGEGLSISLTPPFDGEIAARDVLVRPSALYQVAYRVDYVHDSPPPQIVWQASCILESGTSVVSRHLHTPGSVDSAIKFNVRIPEKCWVLRFQIMGRAPDYQSSSEFRIHDLGISRVTLH